MPTYAAPQIFTHANTSIPTTTKHTQNNYTKPQNKTRPKKALH